jgi:hypothetical protein
MFKVITNMMRNAISNISKERQVGRWCIPNSPGYAKNATLIMDLSNEDHCGACGDNLLNTTYRNTSQAEITKNNNYNYFHNLSEEDIYYFPYTM